MDMNGKGGKGMEMMGMPGMHMPGMPPPDPAMYPSDPFYKTQPCPYVHSGKGGCPMSNNCFFAHSMDELKKMPPEAAMMMGQMMGGHYGMKMPKDKKDKKDKKEKKRKRSRSRSS